MRPEQSRSHPGLEEVKLRGELGPDVDGYELLEIVLHRIVGLKQRCQESNSEQSAIFERGIASLTLSLEITIAGNEKRSEGEKRNRMETHGLRTPFTKKLR